MTYLLFFILLILLSGCSDPDLLPDSSAKKIINKNNIEGYINDFSFNSGDELILYVHAPNKQFSVEIAKFKTGISDWRNKGQVFTLDNIYFEKKSIPGDTQNYYVNASEVGAGWEESLSMTLPQNFTKGLYVIKLFDSINDFFIPFIVNPNIKMSEIAVLSATNTWQAYNIWGGKSFYNNHVDTSGPTNQVSFERPLTSEMLFSSNPSHLANAELFLIEWLYKNNILFDLYTNMDLHNSNFLTERNYQTLIINIHDEYWSQRMLDNLKSFLNQGGNLIYLGGNGIYWKVRIENNLMFKDPLWRSLGKSEASILGVQYDRRGYDTYAPYKVLNDTSRVFDNTGLENGDQFGLSNNSKPWLRGGASGHETDKIVQDISPSNINLIAKGINPDEGGADMILYNHQGGGKVFSVGSIKYTAYLHEDSNISIITKNVIENFSSQ